MIDINIHKTFGKPPEFQLKFKDEINEGDLVALYGSSGSGKTTLLRIIAGLTTPDSGRIRVREEEWLNVARGINIKPQKRKIGMVFQDYALFPTMTVLGNLKFVGSKGPNQERIDELIDIFNLEQLLNRYPDSLSGGQKQRVALARTLVGKPQILLLDEPMSAVDTAMRSRLQDYILTVHKKYQLTTILVSHEPGEIIKMANKIIVMEDGRVTSRGHPREIFDTAKISGKFKFIGEVVDISKHDVVYLVTVRVNNDTVKIIADPSEIDKLTIGAKVLVASKAFNPIISLVGD